MIKANEANKKVIRAIAKKHGIVGCAQPLHAVIVGKQGLFLSAQTYSAFVQELQNNGFFVESPFGSMIDTVMVWKA